MAGLDWPGLLAWSTKYHDGTSPSEFKQMSDEDKRFLEKAMEIAMSQIEDPNKVLVEAKEQILSESRTDESITTALEVIDRCCDDPDAARNVEKLGVLQPLLDLLGTYRGAIAVRTMEVLALFFSNNPNIQEAGMKRGALELLGRLTKESAQASDERSKAFRALVALVRNVKDYELQLLKSDGVEQLLLCLDLQELPGTREKATSFVRSLVENESLPPETAPLLAPAVVAQFEKLEDAGIQFKETVASCVQAFAMNFKEHLPAETAEAVERRLGGLREAKDPEAETEISILTGVLQTLRA